MAKKLKRTDILIRVGFFIVAAGVLLLLCPRGAKYQYQFELGKPWQYDLLTADFDFPIYKDKDEFRKERENVLNNKVLYFQYNANTGTNVVNSLTSEIKKMVKEANAASVRTNETIHFIEKQEQYIAYLQKELKAIYKAGLMADADFNAVKDNASDHIVIIDSNNMGKSMSKDNLYSISRARNVIETNLPENLHKSWLDEIHLNKFLLANISYDEDMTDKVLAEEYRKVSATQGMVQRGERIIDKGEIVTEQKLKILNSLKQETFDRNLSSQQQYYSTMFGHLMLISFVLAFFFLYTFVFRRDYFMSIRYFTMTLMLITVYFAATSLIVRYTDPDLVYVVPYALVPMIISTFYDTRTAFFTHIIVVLLTLIVVAVPLEFVLLQIPAGMITIFISKDLENRSQLIKCALAIFAIYCLIYLSYGLMLDGDVVVVDKWMFLWFGINGIFLLFAYPFIYLIEKLLGFTSNVTLLELSNTNNTVLRKLSEEAPGTFQHVLQVSNLSADIAAALGANALLARTGALYHDIGKMKNPAFFTENQHKGINPHSQLRPEQSAHVIIDHVKNGVDIARQNTLPQCVIDIIKTHHGKSKTRYFYNTWINNNPGKAVDDARFTYDGPNPMTVEQGIIMICDAIEAASRSLPEYTDETINNLVENIVGGIVDNHYLDDTPIKMNQIKEIKDILKDKLKNIYHTRIAYPELKNPQ